MSKSDLADEFDNGFEAFTQFNMGVGNISCAN